MITWSLALYKDSEEQGEGINRFWHNLKSNMKSLPPLPSLNYLATNSPAFQDLLDSISIYRDTLQYLVISGTNMSRFPPEVQSLSRLIELDLSYNQFDVLPAGSIAVSAKLSNPKLINSAVRAIEPGAFRGNRSLSSRWMISKHFGSERCRWLQSNGDQFVLPWNDSIQRTGVPWCSPVHGWREWNQIFDIFVK